MPTNQGLQQESVRAVTGTALSYNGDWMALFDAAGIPEGSYNGRLHQWCNLRTGTDWPSLPAAMQAFAESQGYQSWSAMGTFDAAGNRSYDFSGATMPAGATLERASTGTRFNSSGVLVSAAIDAARFDYDPATLALLGLLVEPQRTNHAPNSAALNNYAATNGSWTADDAVAPDGATAADKFTNTTTGGFHYFRPGAGITIGNPCCYSIFAKKLSQATACLLLNEPAAGAAAYYNLDTLGITNGPFGSPFAAVGIANVGGSWRRLYAENVIVSNNPLWETNCGGFGAASGDAILWWGAQSEGGSFPTSYIPTGGSSVTRSADVLTLDLDDGDWNLSVVTPGGTFTTGAPVTVSGANGYEFDWSDLTGATGQRHVLSITAEGA